MNRSIFISLAIVAKLAAESPANTLPAHLTALTTLRAAGRFEEAHQEGVSALVIAEKLAQPDIRLALALNSVASLEQDTGNWLSSENHYKQSLRVLDRLPKDQFIEGRAAVDNNLGTLYTKMNRPDRAEPLIREAISIRTQLLGQDNPETIRSRMNLAQLLQIMDRNQEAAQQFHELMQFWIAHPEMKIERMITSNNLAVINIRQGRFVEAASELEQVLADFQNLASSNKLFKARVQISLAHCYRVLGKLPRAEDLINQSQQTLADLFGFNHPDYARALYESALILRKSGRKALASKQERQARAISERHAEANLLGHTVDIRTLAASK